MLRALGSPGQAAPATLEDPGGGSGAAAQGPPELDPQPALGSWKGTNVLVPRKEVPAPPGCQGQLRGHKREGRARQSCPPPTLHPKNPKTQGFLPEKSCQELPEFRERRDRNPKLSWEGSCSSSILILPVPLKPFSHSVLLVGSWCAFWGSLGADLGFVE